MLSPWERRLRNEQTKPGGWIDPILYEPPNGHKDGWRVQEELYPESLRVIQHFASILLEPGRPRVSG